MYFPFFSLLFYTIKASFNCPFGFDELAAFFKVERKKKI